jgi:hypothetical protein
MRCSCDADFGSEVHQRLAAFGSIGDGNLIDGDDRLLPIVHCAAPVKYLRFEQEQVLCQLFMLLSQGVVAVALKGT